MSRTKYVLDVVHFDASGQRSSVQSIVERDWPGAPRQGESVSLGGGDRLLAEVVDIEWRDGWVKLLFVLNENEHDVTLAELSDLGFAPLSVPDEPPALG